MHREPTWLLRACLVALMTTGMQVCLAIPLGSLVSWGWDSDGQVSGTPSGNYFVEVSAGASFSLARRGDGSLIAWGFDDLGQVSGTPSGNDFIEVSAGAGHSVARCLDGSLISWGRNNWHQVSDTPSDTDFVEVTAGTVHSVARRSDGSLVSWGCDSLGQVSGTPSGNDYVEVDAGDNFSVARRSDGSLVSWGYDPYGQVSGTPSGNDFVEVSAGGYHSVARRSDGSLISWGSDDYAEVSGTPSGNDFVEVSAGWVHSVARRSNGSLISWGHEEALNGTPLGTGFAMVSAGGAHSVAIYVPSTPTATPSSTGTSVPTSTATPTLIPSSTSTMLPTTTPTAVSTATGTPLPSVGMCVETSDLPLAGLCLYGDQSPSLQDLAGLPALVSSGTRQILAHYASGNRWYTGVAVGNPNGTDAQVTLKAYSETGSIRDSETITLPGHGSLSKTISSLFDRDVTGTGWLEVTSDVGLIAMDLFGDQISGGIAAVPAGEPEKSLVLPHFVHSNRWWTGIAIVNPGGVATDVTLIAYTQDGVEMDRTERGIVAGAKITGLVEALLPLTANRTGWVLVSSTPEPVAGLLVYGDRMAVPNRISGLSGMKESTRLHFAEFRSNASWWTGIAIVNPSLTTAANMTLTGYGSDGAVIDENASVSIGPLQKTVGFVSSFLDLDGNESGWVDVSADVPVVGFELLNGDDALSEMWGLAGIESQPAELSLYFPHFKRVAPWWTWFAVANPNGTGAPSTWTAYDADGHEASSPTWLIPGHGRIADLVEQIMGF